MLVALTAVVLVLERRTRARTRSRSAPAPPAAPRVPLGRWRWPALAFCGLVVGLFLVVPLGVLVCWLGAGASTASRASPGRAALRSVGVAAVAAGVAALAALPVAFLA